MFPLWVNGTDCPDVYDPLFFSDTKSILLVEFGCPAALDMATMYDAGVDAACNALTVAVDDTYLNIKKPGAVIRDAILDGSSLYNTRSLLVVEPLEDVSDKVPLYICVALAPVEDGVQEHCFVLGCL